MVSALGAGGMGEVYRATDTTLGRDVAIKVLPAEVACDPERLARFRREAQVLAALNHRNIAAIHGLEEVDGQPFLALELVPGEDLSERLKRGRIPIEEALDIATQIAEALGAAHEKGIVHRDLKPANVKLAPDGQVKVLDFGLAKAWAGERAISGSSGDLSQSPTLARTGTAAGIILGTAAYMSPEQASGRPVDRRSDIWSFGVLLFEMLTGERLFTGENVSEILASILKDEPSWEKLPERTPPSLRRLLTRCLCRKPRERLHDIGDARLEIEEARRELASGPTGPTRAGAATKGRAWLAWGLAAVAIAAAGAMAGARLLSSREGHGPLHLSLPLAPAQLAGVFCVSADGTRLAFPGLDEKGQRLLYVRSLAEPAARALPGTGDALLPFFSPDGEWIAYTDSVSALKKVSVNGGPVVTLVKGNLRNSRGTWTGDGWIVLAQPTTDRPGELHRIRADGGALEPVPARDEDARQIVRSVSAGISGSGTLLLTVGNLTAPDDQAVAVHIVETGERRVLVPGGSVVGQLASGHLVYLHSGQLMAGKLDAGGTRLVGAPVSLGAVTGDEPVAWATVAPGGTLVYATRRDDAQVGRLTRIGPDGRTTPLALEGSGEDPRLSPDGTRLVVGRQQDVWVLALERGTLTRLSSAPGEDETGVFSPDGQSVAWAGSRPGEKRTIFRRRADASGPEERVWSDERHFHLASWTAQGILVTVSDPGTGWDVLLLEPGQPRSPRPVLNGTFDETSARLSPDGRLLAFVSNETGREEIYVQSFPEPGGRVQVSVDGGLQPVWRPGTRELVFRSAGKVMSVTLRPGHPLDVSAPRTLQLDRLPGLDDTDHTAFAVDADGGLLAVVESDRSAVRDLRIALGWTTSLGLER